MAREELLSSQLQRELGEPLRRFSALQWSEEEFEDRARVLEERERRARATFNEEMSVIHREREALRQQRSDAERCQAPLQSLFQAWSRVEETLGGGAAPAAAGRPADLEPLDVAAAAAGALEGAAEGEDALLRPVAAGDADDMDMNELDELAQELLRGEKEKKD